LFKHSEGDLLFGTQDVSRKVRNVKGNPNVTVLIDDSGPPPRGLVIYGSATLDYENVIEKRATIFEKYGRSPEQALAIAQGLAIRFKPVVIRVKPLRMVSFDYGKGSLT
jgi:hypothetical protein